MKRVRLTPQEVQQVRHDFVVNEMSLAQICVSMGKPRRVIRDLLKGKTYPQVPCSPEMQAKILQRFHRISSWLSHAKVHQIRYRRAVLGHSIEGLGREYGVTSEVVTKLLRGLSYQHVVADSQIKYLLGVY